MESLYFRRIESLDFPSRVRHILQRCHIDTVEEMLQYSREDLLHIHGLGTDSLKIIDEFVATNHLEWMSGKTIKTEPESKVGEIIRSVLQQRGMAVTDFAKAISCSREYAHRIFRMNSIDTDLLLQICNVLQYNFFARLSEEFFGKDNSIALQ